MNNDLISRKALKKAILEHCRSEIEAINHFWYDDTIISLIDNAPSVDTFTFDDMKKGINVGYKAGRLTEKWERSRGEWKEFKYGLYYCSRCFERVGKDIERIETLVSKGERSNYCPICGAKMGGTT